MKYQNGFSLLELIIVISLFSIVAGLAMPSLTSWVDSTNTTSSALDIKGILQYAKSEAVKSQTNVAVSFSSGTGDSGEYKVYIDNGANEVFDTGDIEIRTGNVKKNITLFQPEFAGVASNITRFNAMGLAIGSAGSVDLRNKESDSFRRIVISNSGTIQLQKSSSGTDGSWVQ